MVLAVQYRFAIDQCRAYSVRAKLGEDPKYADGCIIISCRNYAPFFATCPVVKKLWHRLLYVMLHAIGCLAVEGIINFAFYLMHTSWHLIWEKPPLFCIPTHCFENCVLHCFIAHCAAWRRFRKWRHTRSRFTVDNKQFKVTVFCLGWFGLRFSCKYKITNPVFWLQSHVKRCNLFQSRNISTFLNCRRSFFVLRAVHVG